MPEGKAEAHADADPDGKDMLVDRQAERPGVTQQITAPDGRTMDAIRLRSE